MFQRSLPKETNTKIDEMLAEGCKQDPLFKPKVFAKSVGVNIENACKTRRQPTPDALKLILCTGAWAGAAANSALAAKIAAGADHDLKTVKGKSVDLVTGESLLNELTDGSRSVWGLTKRAALHIDPEAQLPDPEIIIRDALNRPQKEMTDRTDIREPLFKTPRRFALEHFRSLETSFAEEIPDPHERALAFALPVQDLFLRNQIVITNLAAMTAILIHAVIDAAVLCFDPMKEALATNPASASDH